MSNHQLLENEDKLETSMGKAYLCERVVMRGKDLHHELGGDDWLKFYLFSITGREFSEAQLTILNFFWVATSYPDSSIWPNHVAALSGSARSTASLSLSAGMAVSEASVYGRRPDRKALDFFYRIGAALKNGERLEDFVDHELKERKRIYGYGRPLASIDERIPHTLSLLRELGLDKEVYLNIALDVYRYLKRTRGLSMNIAALYSAVAADIGFTPEEYQQFMTPAFIAGMVPCYQDARDRPEGSFFPVRCESVVYTGRSARDW